MCCRRLWLGQWVRYGWGRVERPNVVGAAGMTMEIGYACTACTARAGQQKGSRTDPQINAEEFRGKVDMQL